MTKILLDYIFPIASIVPTAPASTDFLKQVAIVVKPKGGGSVGVITEASSMAQVLFVTDNTEAQALFDAGMTRVYVITMNDLELATVLQGAPFFTVLVSSDFSDADMTNASAYGTATVTSFANLLTGTADTVTIAGVTLTAQAGAATPGTNFFQAVTSNDVTAQSLANQINAHATLAPLVIATVVGAVVTVTAKAVGAAGNLIGMAYVDNGASVGITTAHLVSAKLSGGAGITLGSFQGVTGVSSTNDTFLETQAVIANRAAFHTTSGTKAKNMFYAFGKLLSNVLNWTSQQFIEMPLADDIDLLGEANTLFAKKINFVLEDAEYGKRLGLFAAGSKAIVAPYIEKNLKIDLQSKALQYISGNQPAYTLTEAALLEDELQKVIDGYITRRWIDAGIISVLLEQENWTASGYINISEPKAMWRIFGEIRQTL